MYTLYGICMHMMIVYLVDVNDRCSCDGRCSLYCGDMVELENALVFVISCV